MMKKTLILTALFSALGSAYAAEPLKQPGKTTLYQRVLSTPECELIENIGGAKKPVPTFSRFYVYARENQNGQNFLQVGPDTQGKTVGWIPESCAVPWNIQMTLTFTNPAGTGRDSLLFFKDRGSLEKIVDSSSKSYDLGVIRKDLADNGSSDVVVAEEPKEFVDFQNQFYLLPILQGEEVMNSDGLYERVLEIASVTKQEAAAPQAAEKAEQPAKAEDLKQAVVFVVDASISMDPYINRTKDAINLMYKRLEEGLGDQVKFGLIAFRSNTKVTPGLEYTAKIFADPNTTADGVDFMAKVGGLKQAKVSSALFDEDAYAGVDMALQEIDWSEFAGRSIVLITDAGAIDGSHKLSSTGMDAAQLRLEAEGKNIDLYAMHLKTPAGRKNHASAEAQYTNLTANSKTNDKLYYEVDAGDIISLGEQVESLANRIITNGQMIRDGKGEELLEMDADAVESKVERDAILLGKAMYLAYLGKIHGQKAPSVFKGWISDRDFLKPDVPTAEVRVLLTKSQLSDLADMVKNIADAGNEGLIAPSEMFNQLRSVAAAMGQDPDKIKSGSSATIADLGLMGEYLDGVPYRSQITGIDEETWKSMGVAQQEKFVRDLYRKLTHYKRFNEDVDRWISLSDGSDPKDFVYPVPLEALP